MNYIKLFTEFLDYVNPKVGEDCRELNAGELAAMDIGFKLKGEFRYLWYASHKEYNELKKQVKAKKLTHLEEKVNGLSVFTFAISKDPYYTVIDYSSMKEVAKQNNKQNESEKTK